jgi:hypothetical protein
VSVINQQQKANNSLEPTVKALNQLSPQSQDMSAEALGELADIVHGYAEEGRIVGAELMVLKNRYIVLHEVFGLKSQEDEIPMEKIPCSTSAP